MAIDQNVSDLFFNTDLNQAKLIDNKGRFAGWNEPILKSEAFTFLECLGNLKVSGLPSCEALVKDFLERI